MAKKDKEPDNLIAKNRKAYFSYEIIEDFEAGIVLLSSEVKSLRNGGCNISDAYADIRPNEKGSAEAWLLNLSISEYSHALKNHAPKRPRKLLMNRKEIKSLIGKIEQKGFTVVPLALYYSKKGFVKVKLGIARGKNQRDKRDTIKNREWDRKKQRVMKNAD